MSNKTNDEINELEKERHDGDMVLDFKRYLHKFGATELAERIHESTTQEQEKIIIESLVSSYEKKWGNRLYK